MKYLKSKFINLTVLLFVSICGYAQEDIVEQSSLKDFQGMWKFTPEEGSNDTTFIHYFLVKENKMIDVHYWKKSKEISIREKPSIIGFNDDFDREINKLSDLKDKGQHLYFYESNINAPNDNIKYFRTSRRSCFASYNGIGTDSYLGVEMMSPKNGEADYIVFNFNGRDNDFYRKVTHLPNFIILLLLQDSVKWEKLRPFLDYDYKKIQSSKAIIYKSINNIPTNMYLIKNDVVEVLEEQGDWLKFRYYGKKVIEGWIKKSDVE